MARRRVELGAGRRYGRIWWSWKGEVTGAGPKERQGEWIEVGGFNTYLGDKNINSLVTEGVLGEEEKEDLGGHQVLRLGNR